MILFLSSFPDFTSASWLTLLGTKVVTMVPDQPHHGGWRGCGGRDGEATTETLLAGYLWRCVGERVTALVVICMYVIIFSQMSSGSLPGKARAVVHKV